MGDVSRNLQPARYERRRKMSMRAMTTPITVPGRGGTLRETAREIGLGDHVGRCNLQSERYEGWRKMHNKGPV